MDIRTRGDTKYPTPDPASGLPEYLPDTSNSSAPLGGVSNVAGVDASYPGSGLGGLGPVLNVIVNVNGTLYGGNTVNMTLGTPL